MLERSVMDEASTPPQAKSLRELTQQALVTLEIAMTANSKLVQTRAAEAVLKFAGEHLRQLQKQPPLREQDFERLGRILAEVSELCHRPHDVAGALGGPAVAGAAQSLLPVQGDSGV